MQNYSGEEGLQYHLQIRKHRNMYINVNKSGHMKSLIYSLTIGLKPK